MRAARCLFGFLPSRSQECPLQIADDNPAVCAAKIRRSSVASAVTYDEKPGLTAQSRLALVTCGRPNSRGARAPDGDSGLKEDPAKYDFHPQEGGRPGFCSR